MTEFEEIYTANYGRVFAFMRRMCADRSLCEEMTQETFMQAILSFHRYNGSCEIFTWLAAIAKNTYFKYLRKKRIETVDIELLVGAEDCDTQSRPEEVLMRKLRRESFMRIIGQLPEKQRDVIILRIFADLKFSQIADSLKISETSAKVIFHRAKAKLKEELENEI